MCTQVHVCYSKWFFLKSLVPMRASHRTIHTKVASIVEGSMAEATQPVQQGEGMATTTSPVSSYPRPRGRRRVVWFIVLLLLGGIAGTAAWQRLDIQAVWQRLSMQPVEEQAVSSPASQAANVAILHEHQRQQLTMERETTGKVSFNEERLTPVYTPYAGRVLEVLAYKGAAVRPGQPLLVLEAPELVTVQNH